MFSPSQRNGVIALGVVSFLSLIALLIVLLPGVFLWPRQRLTAIGLFFVLLLFWELVQAISWVMELQWVIRNSVEPGPLCIAQGLLKVLSAIGTSLSTIGLSWCILQNYAFRAREFSLKHATMVYFAMTVLQLLVTAIPTGIVGVEQLYQPSGFWCWLPRTHYYALKIVTTYIFYWTSAGFSLLAALIYFASTYVDRRLPCGPFWIGFPTRDDGIIRMGFLSEAPRDHRQTIFGFNLDVDLFGRGRSIFLQYRRPPGPPDPEREVIPPDPRRYWEALKLLSFPITYAILVIPLSIVRFRTFKGKVVGPGATIFVGIWFALTGFVEVVLFLLFRPNFGLAIPRQLDLWEMTDNPSPQAANGENSYPDYQAHMSDV